MNAFDFKFGSKRSLRGPETVRKTHSSTRSSSASSTSRVVVVVGVGVVVVGVGVGVVD